MRALCHNSHHTFQISKYYFSSCGSEIRKYLLSKGLSTNQVQSLTEEIAPSISLTEWKSMDQNGINQLLQSLNREYSKHSTSKQVPVKFQVSNEKRQLQLNANENESVYDMVLRIKDLSSLLECTCGGMAACSTCHVFIDPVNFEKLPPPEEAELDMLDLAKDVSKYSRLGCQIKIKPELKDLVITIPSDFNDLYGR